MQTVKRRNVSYNNAIWDLIELTASVHFENSYLKSIIVSVKIQLFTICKLRLKYFVTVL